MDKNYNWRCKVCDMVNEHTLNACQVCAAPKVLTPLHAEILSRAHQGLAPDETLLKEQAQQERLATMHPLAELLAAVGVMGMLLSGAIFKFAMTIALHFWAIGFFAVSWLILKLGEALNGALNNGGTVRDARTEVLKEKP